MIADEDGSLTGAMLTGGKVSADGQSIKELKLPEGMTVEENKNISVFCDYYILKAGKDVSELQIDAANFAGYYYVEASTLFRRQIDGKDLPAEITFPNVKIQSNFTFTMASTGDPSTFTFTMDAMPGYTYFDKTKKVLCVMQIVEDTATEGKKDVNPVMDHPKTNPYHEIVTDSVTGVVTGE